MLYPLSYGGTSRGRAYSAPIAQRPAPGGGCRILRCHADGRGNCQCSGGAATAARTATVDPDGHLRVGDIDLLDLAAKFGTPLFVYDEFHLRQACRAAVEAWGEGVAYAAKAFLCRAMARLACEEGMHLDVASGGELHVALSAGVPPEQAGPARQQQVRGGVGRRTGERRGSHRRRLVRRDRPSGPPARYAHGAPGPSPGPGSGHARRRGPHP